MLLKRFLFVFTLILTGNLVFSQSKAKDYKSFIYLNWANDLLVTTDYYFSNGLELGYIKKSKNRILFKIFDCISFDGFSAIQDMFTPTDLDIDTILSEDRPYAAYLIGSYQKHLFVSQKNNYLNAEIIAGIIGKGALGRHLQQITHDLTPSKPPQGWNNQVNNDLALNLNLSIEKGFVGKDKFILNAFSKARLGTLYTDWSIGGRFRFGKFNDFFQTVKNLTFESPDKWQYYLELKPYVKVVGYNATLQGGLFNTTSPYTISSSNISRIVGMIDLSLTASYKNFYFNGLLTWNSKEFVSAKWHQWITLEFGWMF